VNAAQAFDAPHREGVYVNFLGGDEHPGRIREAYGDSIYNRLVDIQNRRRNALAPPAGLEPATRCLEVSNPGKAPKMGDSGTKLRPDTTLSGVVAAVCYRRGGDHAISLNLPSISLSFAGGFYHRAVGLYDQRGHTWKTGEGNRGQDAQHSPDDRLALPQGPVGVSSRLSSG
jgi:hypothetical protein